MFAVLTHCPGSSQHTGDKKKRKLILTLNCSLLTCEVLRKEAARLHCHLLHRGQLHPDGGLGGEGRKSVRSKDVLGTCSTVLIWLHSGVMDCPR